jgi:nucleoside-diphosphate-sugar epimerase
VNIGSDEMVSIDRLAEMIMSVAGKKVRLRHVPGPLGVAGRNSDNRLIEKVLGWRPTAKLRDGIARTYPWIERQVRSGDSDRAVS